MVSGSIWGVKRGREVGTVNTDGILSHERFMSGTYPALALRSKKMMYSQSFYLTRLFILWENRQDEESNQPVM